LYNITKLISAIKVFGRQAAFPAPEQSGRFGSPRLSVTNAATPDNLTDEFDRRYFVRYFELN